MGRRGYAPEFRRRVLDLVDAGRPIVDVARDLGISQQSIYRWRAQDRVDRGLAPGRSSVETAELTSAKRRIRELEAELAIALIAVKELKDTAAPKAASRRSR